jgi:hypothetical protein
MIRLRGGAAGLSRTPRRLRPGVAAAGVGSCRHEAHERCDIVGTEHDIRFGRGVVLNGGRGDRQPLSTGTPGGVEVCVWLLRIIEGDRSPLGIIDLVGRREKADQPPDRPCVGA